MKFFIQKTCTMIVGIVFIMTAFISLPPLSRVNAQSCGVNETSGNLIGYLMTDNMDEIYLSTESWNDDPLNLGHAPTTEIFSTSYDRQTGQFFGRAWSPVAGWVDFDSQSTTFAAVYESIESNPDGWGYLDPVIDLSSVTYSVDSGSFNGFGYHGGYIYADPSNDNEVGAGNIDFSAVNLIQPSCTQFVSLAVNGASDINRSTCPVSAPVYINWASENVQNCVTNSSNWSGPGLSLLPNTYQTGTNYQFNGNFNGDIISIACEGFNGETIIDSAQINCGTITNNPGGTSSNPVPEFKEV